MLRRVQRNIRASGKVTQALQLYLGLPTTSPTCPKFPRNCPKLYKTARSPVRSYSSGRFVKVTEVCQGFGMFGKCRAVASNTLPRRRAVGQNTESNTSTPKMSAVAACVAIVQKHDKELGDPRPFRSAKQVRTTATNHQRTRRCMSFSCSTACYATLPTRSENPALKAGAKKQMRQARCLLF